MITRRRSKRPKWSSARRGGATSSSMTRAISPTRRGWNWSKISGLLDEVAGLVEWPVVLIGAFDAEFLALPPEVIRATIRANQKCFVLRDAATDAPRQ